MPDQHIATIQEVKQLSDGMVAFRARCCDDSSTDSWHTVNTVRGQVLGSSGQGIEFIALTEADFDLEVAGHLTRVSQQHAATQAGWAAIQKHLPSPNPEPRNPNPAEAGAQ